MTTQTEVQDDDIYFLGHEFTFYRHFQSQRIVGNISSSSHKDPDDGKPLLFWKAEWFTETMQQYKNMCAATKTWQQMKEPVTSM